MSLWIARQPKEHPDVYMGIHSCQIEVYKNKPSKLYYSKEDPHLVVSKRNKEIPTSNLWIWFWCKDNVGFSLPKSWFPEIKPGECKKMCRKENGLKRQMLCVDYSNEVEI